MNKTILIIIAFLLVAIASGGGVYIWQKNKNDIKIRVLQNQITSLQQLSQNNSKTVSLDKSKTYLNEKYRYQLNYPDTIGLAVPGAISPPADSKSDDIVFYKYTGGEILNLYILQNKNNLTLDNLVSKIANGFSKKESITIDDQQSLDLYFTSGTLNTTDISLSGVSMLVENEELIFIQKGADVFMFEIKNTEDKTIAKDMVLSFKSLK